MKKTSLAAFALIASAAGIANAQPLQLDGSDTLEFIMSDLIAFANANGVDPEGSSDVEMLYIGGGSGNAASAMERDTGERAGLNRQQIGPMSRALEPDECTQDPVISPDPPPPGGFPAVNPEQVHIGNDSILNLFGNCSLNAYERVEAAVAGGTIPALIDAERLCAGDVYNFDNGIYTDGPLTCADGICVDATDPVVQCNPANGNADCGDTNWYPKKGAEANASVICIPNADSAQGGVCAPAGGDIEEKKKDDGDKFAIWEASSWLMYFGVDPVTQVQDCASPARQAVLDQLNVYHVYRRDDASGTTGDFRRLLSLPANLGFCDANGDVTDQRDAGTLTDKFDGDPLRVDCDNDEDVCSCDGTLGVVLPILVPPGAEASNVLYPNISCSNAAGLTFSPVNTAGNPVNPHPKLGGFCSDGSEKLVNGCIYPRAGAADGSVANCMYFNKDIPGGPILNQLLRTGSLGNPNCPDANADNDIRSLNLDVRRANGTIVAGGGNPGADWQGRGFYRIHSWSQHAYDFENCGEIMWPNPPQPADPEAALTAECQELDATVQIGCLVGRDARWGKRSRGFSGLQAGTDSCGVGVDVNNTAPKSAPYPFNRKLFINVMAGIAEVEDNIYDGADERSFIDWVLSPAGAPFVAQAVEQNGFGPLAAPGITPQCGN